MTIGFLAMAAASMAWGSLSDRFEPRPVVLAGSTVLAAVRPDRQDPRDAACERRQAARARLFAPQGFDRVETGRAPGGKIAEHDADKGREGERDQDDGGIDQKGHLQG
jgi:hypothetical protein